MRAPESAFCKKHCSSRVLFLLPGVEFIREKRAFLKNRLPVL